MLDTKQNSLLQKSKRQLENSLCEYSKYIFQSRMAEECIPITDTALDNAAEIYAENLLPTIDICLSNLIENDVSNLKSILKK